MARVQTHLTELSGLSYRLDGGIRETEELEMTPNFWPKQLEGWICYAERWKVQEKQVWEARSGFWCCDMLDMPEVSNRYLGGGGIFNYLF